MKEKMTKLCLIYLVIRSLNNFCSPFNNSCSPFSIGFTFQIRNYPLGLLRGHMHYLGGVEIKTCCSFNGR